MRLMIRSFTSQVEDFAIRSVDDDAPAGLRQEFIDLAFYSFEQARKDEVRLHRIITQSLGLLPKGQPYGGFRYAAGGALNGADWLRVYDLICRSWAELPFDVQSDYRIAINRILAGYRIAWDLDEDGQLYRVLPPAVSDQVEAAFRELSQPRFAAALASFREGMSAYHDRPQRGRDTCKNIFDALESVSKAIFGMPNATFGDVLKDARRKQAASNEIIAVLQKLYDMANKTFRHGTPFTLKSAEVDFVLVSCVGGILLFLRL